MLYEEFENLSGVTVSLSYYTEVIEPQYTAMNIDKTEFCTAWVKENKSGICKAVAADLRRLSSTACMYAGAKSQVEKSKEDAAEAIRERDKVKAEAHNLKYDLDAIAEKLENAEKDLEIARADREKYLQEVDDLLREGHNSQEELKALRAENQALKAKLYDMIVAA